MRTLHEGWVHVIKSVDIKLETDHESSTLEGLNGAADVRGVVPAVLDIRDQRHADRFARNKRALVSLRKQPVGTSWRMDKNYVKVGGQWKYLHRAVDRDGDTVDFLLRAKQDHGAARAFFERAIDLHGVPERITIDESGFNTAAIVSIQADSGLSIEMRQSEYLNNIIEQDHRAIKRIARPMLGFNSIRCARTLIVGIEIMHMIRKGQLGAIKDRAMSAANQFYSLAL